MLPIHTFLPFALRRRGYSLRSASIAIARSPAYLSTICRSEMEPTLSVLTALSKLMNISLDDLVAGADPLDGPTPDSSSAIRADAEIFAAYVAKRAYDASGYRADQPGLEEIIAWYISSKGDLARIGSYRDCIDLYHIPAKTARRPSLHRLGPKSLAARCLSNSSTEKLRAILEASQSPFLRSVVRDHLYAAREGMHCSAEEIDFPISPVESVSIRYVRALFSAHLGKRHFIATFAKVIV